jgi:AraC-like DNA-binding protein
VRISDLAKPTVPSSYVLLTLGLAEERGVSRDAILSGLALTPRMLAQPDTRIGLLDYGRICIRAMQLTGDPALGYEFGLHNRVTDHGFVGFGMMSQGTLLEAMQFAVQYFMPLPLPGWNLRLRFEGAQAVIEATETVPYGILRQYAMDMLLVALYTMLRPFLPKAPKVELWFDCARPAYYAHYRQKLPRCRFDMGAIQLRMPAEYLSRPIDTANPVTAKMIGEQCERELTLLGPVEEDDLLTRVRAGLVNERGRYPDLERTAARLHLSTRTLIRRLAAHGIRFQQLLDEARHRDSMRLLGDRTLALGVIADRLGYSTAANFSRAFQRWSGVTPGRFRTRMP